MEEEHSVLPEDEELWDSTTGVEEEDAGPAGMTDNAAESPAAEGSAPEQPPPPSINLSAVQTSDAVGNLVPVSRPTGGATSGAGASTWGAGGSRRRIDWAKLESEQRLYGRRGEEATFGKERERVANAGWDPALVVWVSKDQQTAPYDIRSINDDGTTRYIEVKATTSEDPSTPFPISAPELRFGIRQRQQYYIYRVTSIKSEAPRILRYRDPIGQLENENAYMTMREAALALPSPADE